MDKIRVLNTDILNITRDELLRNLDKGIVFNPNIDCLIKLHKDREFYDVYKQADWVICDSRVLLQLSKLLPVSLREAIPGSSFFPAFYQYHKDDPNCRIFLLGAKEGVAATAMKKINKSVGRDIVVGAHSPSFGFEKNEDECLKIIKIINESGANVLAVGLGAPKQEKWMVKYRHMMPNVDILLALGATIDFEADAIKRAPKIWQKLCMEWLYRLLREPRRLFRRYMIDDVKFFWLFGKQLMGKYRDPFAPKE